MDQYLIYFVPFIIIGVGMMLAPFISDLWPDLLVRFVEFCASMANGVWVAGVAIVILIGLGLPLPAAAIVSLPVMFFAGRYIASLSEADRIRTNDRRRRAWEEQERREEDERNNPKP